jgi:uncharacterized protein
MARRRAVTFTLLFVVSLVALSISPAATGGRASQRARDLPPPPEVELVWGVRIPMRDGVTLGATVYKPKQMETPLPVIFTLTPYIGDTYLERALYFARNGYVFALVDCRGRGNSGGEFEPFANEGRDGYDAVEWLARQPWSNGRVGMWGGSYAGYDQWATLKEGPPHLATIAPAASAYPGVDFPMFKNIFASYNIQWLTYTSGVTPNRNIFGASAFWIDRFREMYLKHAPYKELDRIAGNTSTAFAKWLEHPTPDAYWDAMVPTPEQYRNIRIPVLTITGHYDGDQQGALEFYRKHMQYGTPEARASHYLVIGPWDHAGTRTPARSVGGLTFGQASLLDLNELHKEWYDWVMKGRSRPSFLKDRVVYYMMGADQWKYARDLGSIATSRRLLYLDSPAGRAQDVFESGRLVETPPGASQPDRYTYDPLDVSAAELEREESQNALTDQRSVLRLRGNALVYHSAPFERDTEVTGTLRLVAWMAIDVPDTDFRATVYEVLSDGTSVMLTEDLLRARYRESLREARLVAPFAVLRYEFDTFQYFSREISKGSRLRLILTSPNTIYLEKNYNAGGVVSAESGKDARTAHVTLYHDTEHRSYLELPLVGPK